MIELANVNQDISNGQENSSGQHRFDSADKHNYKCIKCNVKARFALLYSVLRDALFPDNRPANGWIPDQAIFICEQCGQKIVEEMDDACPYQSFEECVDLTGWHAGTDNVRLPYQNEYLLPTPEKPVMEYSIYQGNEKWICLLLTPALIEIIHQYWADIVSPQGYPYVDYFGYLCEDYLSQEENYSWLQWHIEREKTENNSV